MIALLQKQWIQVLTPGFTSCLRILIAILEETNSRLFWKKILHLIPNATERVHISPTLASKIQVFTGAPYSRTSWIFSTGTLSVRVFFL